MLGYFGTFEMHFKTSESPGIGLQVHRTRPVEWIISMLFVICDRVHSFYLEWCITDGLAFSLEVLSGQRM